MWAKFIVTMVKPEGCKKSSKAKYWANFSGNHVCFKAHTLIPSIMTAEKKGQIISFSSTEKNVF